MGQALRKTDGATGQQVSFRAGPLRPGDRLRFILSGDAFVTLVGRKARYTFHVKKNNKPDAEATHWVSVLRGQNNEADYEFVGGISTRERNTDTGLGRKDFYVSPKSRLSNTTPCVVAFRWFWHHPEDDRLTVLHAGRCGRCGRLLTTPQSIHAGFGPECVKMIGGVP